MTAKVLKKTKEEVLTEQGSVERVIGIEISLVKDDAEVGRVNVNEYSGNFNVFSPIGNIETVADAIANALNALTV